MTTINRGKDAGSEAGRIIANRNRTTAAAARTVPAAQQALPTCKPQHRPILQARIDHPTDTLTQLANRLGITKHTYASALYRALPTLITTD